MKLPTMPYLTALQWALAAAALVAVVLTAWWLITSPAREAQRAAEGRATTIQSRANSASASDAAVITDRAVNAAAANEQQSRETEVTIRAAPGADQPLNPSLNEAARRRLCLRESYRNRPECR